MIASVISLAISDRDRDRDQSRSIIFLWPFYLDSDKIADIHGVDELRGAAVLILFFRK